MKTYKTYAGTIIPAYFQYSDAECALRRAIVLESIQQSEVDSYDEALSAFHNSIQEIPENYDLRSVFQMLHVAYQDTIRIKPYLESAGLTHGDWSWLDEFYDEYPDHGYEGTAMAYEAAWERKRNAIENLRSNK